MSVRKNMREERKMFSEGVCLATCSAVAGGWGGCPLVCEGLPRVAEKVAEILRLRDRKPFTH